jgi:biopolymer transport protein ExbD
MYALNLPKRQKSAISLTALIDVVFILLMFFMLTSSFTQFSALAVNASVAAHSAAHLRPQLLVLTQNGSLSIKGNTAISLSGNLTDQQLRQQLDSDQPIVLLPANQTQIQVVVATLERLHKLGFTGVTLGQAAKSTPTVKAG